MAGWRRTADASDPSRSIRADPDVPIDKVQRLMETAQEAGFTQCVLRPAELPRPKTQDPNP